MTAERRAQAGPGGGWAVEERVERRLEGGMEDGEFA